MHEKREKLLRKAHENNGRLSMREAQRMYSSKGSAKEAVQALDSMEDDLVRGVFKLEKLPPELKDDLRGVEA